MKHVPVMLEEVLQALAIREDGVYLDGTFGRGGHSREILHRLGSDGRLLALDRDADAVDSENARKMRDDYRFQLQQGCFSRMRQIIEAQGLLGNVDGILLDLGVSSPQLDDPQRGFSFLRDGPLDMRMNTGQGMSAAEWLEQVSEQELVRVLFEFGEERFARRIAAAVVKERVQEPLRTTRQLARLIEAAVPVREKHKHPATRSFQAIRIHINRELEALQEALQQTLQVLKPGGRLVVISFHSLEDRIVKRFIRDQSRGPYHPGRYPVADRHQDERKLRRIGKAVRAGGREVAENPRARSAVLRCAERI